MRLFDATFESLYNFKAPEWYKNAKFGIWSHWGPQCVPMFGDWYARKMYQEGTPAYERHLRLYGHPSRFGYKDLCELWKAENFDPEELIDFYIDCGARFFAAQTTHHDNFFNYDSAVNPMNSVNVGPHKDICAMWERAARNRGLPFGITEHLAASFSWWRFNKGADRFGPYKGIPYDGNDPAFRNFYHNNYCHVTDDPNVNIPWYTQDEGFHEYWLRAVTEMIDRFRPDFLYSDGSLPFGRHWANKPQKCEDDPAYGYGLKAVSRLYNTSIAKYGENRALYLQKNKGPEIYKIGVLDCERSVLDTPSEDVWNTDTCIGNWFYHTDFPYKRPSHIIEMLVDIVSKNGCLMLNVPQRPDGTIDEECRYILKEIGSWLKLFGEGVYSTRPWRLCQEGETKISSGGEAQADWKSGDVRYTCKDGNVYAFLMRANPGETTILKAFDKGRVRKVLLNGYGELPFVHELGTLLIKLPERLPSEYVTMLTVSGDNL